ncbi:SUKH-3 domain-containing protein [Actinoplanes sp. CA-030573]|uniref:SUKH-3 domain-containing protein n=1 Tax=Actinoplanes sp. CA-030573 TaxID=3239898 RepID=UPI003D8D6721
MISRAEAEEIASRWARGETEQRGYACEPALAEFDLGWIIWTRPEPSVLPLPGDGARTVIDRQTGALSTWPAIPSEEIAAQYRLRGPRASSTVDPAVALRRAAKRRPTPTTAAELIVDGQIFRAQGAKGDQTLNHHPLVREALSTIPPSARVRGVDRHAELIAASDALHALGRPGSALTAFLVREPADPQAGQVCRPCESCVAVLVRLGVFPPEELAHTTEWRYGSSRVQGRFPPEVSHALAGGGWLGVELPTAVAPAEEGTSAGAGSVGSPTIAEAERLSGLTAFPAARRALAEFGGVRCGRRGPGRRRAIRLLTFDPLPGARQAATLAEFADVIGAPVFPLGTEGGDALLVLDDRGRVFVLDQAGEWFVGATVDEAVTGLLTGDGPADRLHDDGSWG